MSNQRFGGKYLTYLFTAQWRTIMPESDETMLSDTDVRYI